MHELDDPAPQHLRRPTRGARWPWYVVFSAAWLAYLPLYVILHPYLGVAAGVVALVPVALTAWSLGLLAGVASTIVVWLANNTADRMFHLQGFDAVFEAVSLVTLLAIGTAFGYVHVHHQRLRRTTFDLNERVKELRALHGAMRTFDDPSLTDQERFQVITHHIKQGWQHPAHTEARIVVEEIDVHTDGWRRSQWMLTEPVHIGGVTVGEVQVAYTGTPPGETEGPFLEQEVELLRSLARLISARLQLDRHTEAIRKRERLYHDTMERSNDLILTIGDTGRITFASAASERILGIVPSELVGTTIYDHIHPDDLAPAHEEFSSWITGRNAARAIRLRLRTMHGAWRPTEALGGQTDDRCGQDLMVVVRDISHVEKAERDLRAKTRLLDTIPQAVIATDLEGRITYWNKAAETYYGWTRDEALGQDVMTLTVPDIDKEQGHAIMRDLRAGKNWSGRFRVQHKDGHAFTAYVTDSPIFDEEGALVGVSGLSVPATMFDEAPDGHRKVLHNAEGG